MEIIAKITALKVEARIEINDPLEYQQPSWIAGAAVEQPSHFNKLMSDTEFCIMMRNFADELGHDIEIKKIGSLTYFEE